MPPPKSVAAESGNITCYISFIKDFVKFDKCIGDIYSLNFASSTQVPVHA
jgi:hypothetical protein